MENPKLRFDLPLITENGTVKFGHDPKKLWQTTQLTFNVLERIDALADGTARRRSSMPTGWLSPKEGAECYEIFRAFDKDGSGFLDRDELATIFAATGRSYDEGQLQRALNLITGSEGSTGVTFEQFAALLRVKMTINQEAAIRKRFEHFDLDGSGEISLEELKKGIQGLDSLVTCGEIEEMLKECDTDGNGAVSYDEFLVMVSRLQQRRPSQTPVATPTFTTPSWNTDMPVWV
jgi:Ca2+-binding EF-hand superfamily protein